MFRLTLLLLLLLLLALFEMFTANLKVFCLKPFFYFGILGQICSFVVNFFERTFSLPTILATTLNNDTTIQMKTICKITIASMFTEEGGDYRTYVCIILPARLLAEIFRKVRLKILCNLKKLFATALVHKE